LDECRAAGLKNDPAGVGSRFCLMGKRKKDFEKKENEGQETGRGTVHTSFTGPFRRRLLCASAQGGKGF